MFANPLTILWVSYYCMLVIGLFYSTNLPEAGKDLTLKISLLLWPLGFASWPAPIVKYRTKITLVFAYTTVLSCIIIVLAGIYLWQHSGQPASRIFNFLNVWQHMPNHYIALFASFSIFIFLNAVFTKQSEPLWPLIGSAVLLVFLGIVSVRIQLIAMPVALIFYLIFYDAPSSSKQKIARIGILTVILFGVLALAMPSTRSRIEETFDELRSFNKMVDLKQTNHRVFLWKYGAQVVAEKPILGTGTGAADDALNEKLKDCDAVFWNGHSNYFLHDNRYNFHNAFLQHAATHGLIGFLMLVAIFVLPFVLRQIKINGLHAAFLALCFVSFLTESMLERQAGVLFFGFFYALFFLPPIAKTNGK